MWLEWLPAALVTWRGSLATSFLDVTIASSTFVVLPAINRRPITEPCACQTRNLDICQFGRRSHQVTKDGNWHLVATRTVPDLK